LIGGLARVDVLSAPSATIYVTIYVSDEIVTHLGKVEGAEERRQKHTGGLLAPPYERERLPELELVPRTAVVEGSSWQEHSRDIAIAGEYFRCLLAVLLLLLAGLSSIAASKGACSVRQGLLSCAGGSWYSNTH
jgi:hypothetical protein